MAILRVAGFRVPDGPVLYRIQEVVGEYRGQKLVIDWPSLYSNEAEAEEEIARFKARRPSMRRDEV